MQKARPTGVTILAVLEVLIGLMTLLAGLGLAVLGALAGMPSMGLPDFLSALAGVFGGVLIILGLLSFVIAFGLWTGKGWAWTLSLVLAVLEILFGLISLIGSPGSGIFQIIIGALILYYLYRPNVKSFFGKGSA